MSGQLVTSEAAVMQRAGNENTGGAAAGSGGETNAAATPTVEVLLAPLVIDRLSSPEANTARAEGRLGQGGPASAEP